LTVAVEACLSDQHAVKCRIGCSIVSVKSLKVLCWWRSSAALPLVGGPDSSTEHTATGRRRSGVFAPCSRHVPDPVHPLTAWAPLLFFPNPRLFLSTPPPLPPPQCRALVSPHIVSEVLSHFSAARFLRRHFPIVLCGRPDGDWCSPSPIRLLPIFSPDTHSAAISFFAVAALSLSRRQPTQQQSPATILFSARPEVHEPQSRLPTSTFSRRSSPWRRRLSH